MKFTRFIKISIAMCILSIAINAQVNAPAPSWGRIFEVQNDWTRVYNNNAIQSTVNKGANNKGPGSKNVVIKNAFSRSKITTKNRGSVVTMFTPTANYIMPKLIAEGSKGTLQQKQETERFLSGLLDQYVGVAKKDGFSDNDMAYACEFYITNNYHVYYDVFSNAVYIPGTNEVDTEKTPRSINMTTERAIVKNYADSLAADPSVKKMTDLEKQKFSEMIVIRTQLAWYHYENGLQFKNAKSKALGQQMAKDHLEKLYGVSADKITIKNGVVSIEK